MIYWSKLEQLRLIEGKVNTNKLDEQIRKTVCRKRYTIKLILFQVITNYTVQYSKNDIMEEIMG